MDSQRIDSASVLLSLNRKLQSNWSAWTATSSFSNPQFISEVRNIFSQLEKKVKLRVLIALLGLDQIAKSQCAAEIKKLLKAGSDDTTDQVGVWY